MKSANKGFLLFECLIALLLLTIIIDIVFSMISLKGEVVQLEKDYQAK